MCSIHGSVRFAKYTGQENRAVMGQEVGCHEQKMSTLSRQVNEVKTMMTYIVQKLDSITSGTVNVSSDIAQCTSASSKGPGFHAPSASTTISQSDGISTATTTAIDEQFSDVPLHCLVPADEVLKMKRHSKSIGNFASLMTMRLFPELFTPEHQRFRFNYYGNGNQKEARDGHIYRDICCTSSHSYRTPKLTMKK